MGPGGAPPGSGSGAGAVVVADAAATGARRRGVAGVPGDPARRFSLLRRGCRLVFFWGSRCLLAADAEVARAPGSADDAAAATVERIREDVGTDAAAVHLPLRA